MRICLLLVFAMCCSITNHACSQESNGSLAQVVWAGVSKATGADKSIRWAISISKRDGEKFEAGVATESPSGDKIEFPVH